MFRKLAGTSRTLNGDEADSLIVGLLQGACGGRCHGCHCVSRLCYRHVCQVTPTVAPTRSNNRRRKFVSNRTVRFREV